MPAKSFALRAFPLLLLVTGACASLPDEAARLSAQAERVTITRDNWGLPHIKGRTDADAVFGMVYAQAEDDFNRVETNFINAMGRLAEAEGESAIWRDLRMKLFIQPEDLKARYATSPEWLKKLMIAWADGLNHYLATHPQVKPRVITRFEPWMALSFSEGSIGGDIEGVSLKGIEDFYGRQQMASAPEPVRVREPSGSNGFAIAPSNSASGNALLLINPHTTFFFRSEAQVTSEEGLNAYGASTWGQFFIYQGFNEDAGWMHTTSGLDAVDEFAETIIEQDGKLFYRYGTELRPVETRIVIIPYRAADGSMAERRFTTYRTHHGPIIRAENGKWIAVALMHKPVEALSQSFLRTKARDYAEFVKVSELKANSSNNTIFADSKGNIAYLHPQFIPKRDNRFDYTKPVDGSDPATDWQGLHALSEAPNLLNPQSGWIQNVNNWPWTAAGSYSRKAADFPRYMDTRGENARGINAVRLLSQKRQLTLPTLIETAYDPYLAAFAELVPMLLAAYDALPASDPRKASLAGQIALLRGWDYRWGVNSEPTSLAVFWGEALPTGTVKDSPEQMLNALTAASARLTQDFGSWRVPWGEINRFQRLTGDIQQPFNDAAPSLPVGFTSARWGSLASFGARRWPGTKRYYGTLGNSFVAVVEFGERVKALAVSAGGQSGDPASPHFDDQAALYARGEFRPVYFYPEDLAGKVERVYRPGE